MIASAVRACLQSLLEANKRSEATQMTNQGTTTVTRRQALRRGAAAGAVIWTAPMVISNTAHASGGSNGSKTDGKLDSVTCVWNQRYFRPNRGTPSQPSHDYSGDAFCEVNVGRGWQLLARNEQFVLSFGQVLQFRPWSSHSGGRAAEPLEAPAPTVPATTAAPAPAEDPVEAPAPTVPTTTAAPAPAPAAPAPAAPVTTSATPVAPADVPAEEPQAPTAVETEPPAPQPVDTIVVDMSGRSDLNIGDVFGYFQVVDADPA